MIRTQPFALSLLLLTAVPGSGQQQQSSQPKTGPTASGVFVGRSGKPMAKVRLFLGEVSGDQDFSFAKVKLANIPAALTDADGRFTFSGFKPGTYTIVYLPPGVTLAPNEFSIRALNAVTTSPVPLLRSVEHGGSGAPFPDRTWGQGFTLLKGHTFWLEGANMRIWNASARRSQGPTVEVRKGVIWQEKFDDKKEIKLVGWSF
jgi:hypothetical protein